jgi:glycerol kinase
MAYQTRDVIDSMNKVLQVAGREISTLKVDGGASANELLMQLQADQLQVPVVRSAVQETTALGAAYLAGLAEGVWSSTDDVTAQWRAAAEFSPSLPASVADARHAGWVRAVERARGWASS